MFKLFLVKNIWLRRYAQDILMRAILENKPIRSFLIYNGIRSELKDGKWLLHFYHKLQGPHFFGWNLSSYRFLLRIHHSKHLTMSELDFIEVVNSFSITLKGGDLLLSLYYL